MQNNPHLFLFFLLDRGSLHLGLTDEGFQNFITLRLAVYLLTDALGTALYPSAMALSLRVHG